MEETASATAGRVATAHSRVRILQEGATMSPEPDTLAVAQEIASEHGLEPAQAAATVTAVVRLTEHLATRADLARVEERLETKIGNLDTKTGNLDTKIDDLDTKIGNLDTRIGNLETKIGDLDTKIDGLMWRFVATAIGLVAGVAAVFGLGIAVVRLTA